jgi:hypothetical protein
LRFASALAWLSCMAIMLGQGVGAQEAALRFVHLSADAPQVDVLLDGRPVLRDVPFGGKSGYWPVSAGEIEVRVFPHRAPRRTLEEAMPGGMPLKPLTRRVTLKPGAYYTLALVGFFEPPLQAEERGSLTLRATPPEAQLVVQGPRGYREVLQGEGELTGLEPGEYIVTARYPGYRTATYALEVQPGASTRLSLSLQQGEDEESVVVPATAAERQAEAVWRRTELQLYPDAIQSFPLPGTALVRFVHVAPTVAALNVTLGEEGVVEALAFPNASDYHTVPAGLHALGVARDGGDGDVLSGLTFEAGVIYTLYLLDGVGGGAVTVFAQVDGAVLQELD